MVEKYWNHWGDIIIEGVVDVDQNWIMINLVWVWLLGTKVNWSSFILINHHNYFMFIYSHRKLSQVHSYYYSYYKRKKLNQAPLILDDILFL